MTDPTGTLAHDEVQILARDAKFLLPDETMSHAILGDVVVRHSRMGCYLPDPFRSSYDIHAKCRLMHRRFVGIIPSYYFNMDSAGQSGGEAGTLQVC